MTSVVTEKYKMQMYFAPLEGITGYAYRNAHRAMFTGIDRYYAPFVAPGGTRHFKARERADVEPGHNAGVPLVPQVLSNRAEDFLWAAGELYGMGYGEVNLNLGCPMPTVVRKGRGAGMLADPDALDRFLEEVCEGLEGMHGQFLSKGPEKRQALFLAGGLRFTVKTRIGLEDTGRARDLCAVFSRYPIAEVIVHPRTARDMYRGKPDLDAFAMFLEDCAHPVAYNGDIFSPEDFCRIRDRFPRCRAFMLGRGLLSDPALGRQIRGGPPLQKEELSAFHEALYASARATLPGAAVVLGRMKELWFYMGTLFPGADRLLKDIKKARTLPQYEAAVRVLFARGGLARQE